MQIIWNSEAVERLKGLHTLLELETFDVEGKLLTAYCVVPPEKIGIDGFAMLEANKNLHNEFVNAFKTGNAKLCTDISEHLMGKFGGELDSFYEEILKRFSNT